MFEMFILMIGITIVLRVVMEISFSKRAVRQRTLKHLEKQRIYNEAIRR